MEATWMKLEWVYKGEPCSMERFFYAPDQQQLELVVKNHCERHGILNAECLPHKQTPPETSV